MGIMGILLIIDYRGMQDVYHQALGATGLSGSRRVRRVRRRFPQSSGMVLDAFGPGL